MAIQNRCNVCAGALEPWQRRADGIRILKCTDCEMGVVEQVPPDIEELYRSDYYTSTNEGRGYADYDLIAYHSTAWAASLAQLLCPCGSILDVGCADGTLLASMIGPYQLNGIELSPIMAQRCQQKGIQIVAQSIYEPTLERFHSKYDVVLSIAVLEHVVDFKEACRRALDMTAKDGLFVFEVPLFLGRPEDEIWLRSSLEHIYYPCETALRYIFEESLQFRLIGTELTIQDYGSTYLGVVAKTPERFAEAEDLVRRVLLGPVEAISSPHELACRLLLSVVHAADTDAIYLERIGLLLDDCPTSHKPLLERLRTLWLRDRRRLESTVKYLEEVKLARDYHAERFLKAAKEAEPPRQEHDQDPMKG